MPEKLFFLDDKMSVWYSIESEDMFLLCLVQRHHFSSVVFLGNSCGY
jgi:hypothetical protein